MRLFALFGGCCALVLGGSLARAAPVQYDVGVGLAGVYTEAREELVAPVKFTGPGAALTASLCGRSETSEVETRLHLAPAMLRDRYDTDNAALSAGADSRWRFDLRHGDRAVARLGAMLDVHSWLGFLHAERKESRRGLRSA